MIRDANEFTYYTPGKISRYGTLPYWLGGPRHAKVGQGNVNGFSVQIWEDTKTHERTLCFSGNGLPDAVCRPSVLKGE